MLGLNSRKLHYHCFKFPRIPIFERNQTEPVYLFTLIFLAFLNLSTNIALTVLFFYNYTFVQDTAAKRRKKSVRLNETTSSQLF